MKTAELLSHFEKCKISSIATFSSSSTQHWFEDTRLQSGQLIPFLVFCPPPLYFLHLKCNLYNSISVYSSLILSLLSFLSASAPLQVHQNNVSWHPESQAKGEPATLLLGHDVRVCRCQHAPSTGDISGKRSTAGSPALHHDPEEPGRNAAV